MVEDPPAPKRKPKGRGLFSKEGEELEKEE
jgi:hypothetical protein